MKKLNPLLLITMIMTLTTPLTMIARGQYTRTNTYMDSAHQKRSSISERALAYLDSPRQYDPAKDVFIISLLDFINDSITKKALLGYESDPIYGTDPLAGKRLNILKGKIKAASNALKMNSLEEACQLLLEAYLSTDGSNFRYIDLVYGPAASELAKRLKLLRTKIIGCR